MFSWAIAFLVIALIAAALGFGGVAGTAIVAAKLDIRGGHRSVFGVGGAWARRTTALIRRPRDRSNSTRSPRAVRMTRGITFVQMKRRDLPMATIKPNNGEGRRAAMAKDSAEVEAARRRRPRS